MNKKEAEEWMEALKACTIPEKVLVDISPYLPKQQNMLLVDKEKLNIDNKFRELYKDAPRYLMIIGYTPDEDEKVEWQTQFIKKD